MTPICTLNDKFGWKIQIHNSNNETLDRLRIRLVYFETLTHHSEKLCRFKIFCLIYNQFKHNPRFLLSKSLISVCSKLCVSTLLLKLSRKASCCVASNDSWGFRPLSI